MDERLRFVARLLEGVMMAVLCREYDVSRKTGYKLFDRYKEEGYEGLTDRVLLHLRTAVPTQPLKYSGSLSPATKNALK
jgi:hypothetical protein